MAGAQDYRGAIQPGYISVDSLSISSKKLKKSIDISLITKEFSVYEHMNKPFMSCNIVVEDVTSLFTLLPLTGEESISVVFSLPDPAFQNNFIYNFLITGITDIIPSDKVRDVHYNINCVAPEAFADWTKKIRKSYINMPISEMVEKISKETLGIQKPTVSASEGKRTITIPNMSPSEAIRFLQKDAKAPNTYEPSNYIFFSNMDGYYFKTIEEILATAKSEVDKYYFTEKNFIRKDLGEVGPNEIGPGGLPDLPTSGGVLDSLNEKKKPIEFLKINKYQFLQAFNLENNLKRGAFDNTLMWIDINKSMTKKREYGYAKDYNKFKRVDKNNPGRFVIDDNGPLSKLSGDSKWSFIPSDIETNPETPDQKGDFLHYLIASVAMLDHVAMEITVPGDCTRRVGDVVEILVPEFSAFDNKIGELNKHLAGRYLVVALRHFVNMQNKTGYSCVMQVVKNNYFKNPSSEITGEANNSQPGESSQTPLVTDATSTLTNTG